MELLYLYIPESADLIFKDTQINFTGRYHFHFDKDSRVLTCDEISEAVRSETGLEGSGYPLGSMPATSQEAARLRTG